MKRYGRGWFGDRTRHSLAAKGVATSQQYSSYMSRKQVLAEPVFYARKRESELPFSSITAMVKNGESYQGMKGAYPAADHEDLRLRGITAIEMRDMDNTLSTIDKNGVDKVVQLAEKSPSLREKVLATLRCRQRGSFIAPVKRDAILKRLA
jgi:hypothetical protein